ncbi:hypothetical protein [Capnocytophaga canimorsus]|uniref:hypothetical protein n=1 Tax=Capnocytophaga canimorsus TaxID=28188 RepID=UPI000C23F34C|nr:hypothetical protein [Capnocytophaga canimorsus]PJI79605.1 hypothetical protein CLV61_1491 [Capnocytophaga canimorsus]STA71530.1 Uncharacterised protein [Capnocytophaga canimorsus]
MKNIFIALFLLFSVLKSVAQTAEIIHGQVLSDTIALQGVHIENLENKKIVYTDADGNFSIPVREGNTLKATHIGKKTVFRTITKYDLKSIKEPITIRLVDEIEEIKGVEVSKYQKIDAKEIGIIQHTPIKRTFAEKREYANTKIRGNSLLSINIIGLINAITGKRKMYKKEVKYEKNKKVADYIRNQMSDFLSKQLGLNAEEIETIAYLAMEKTEYHSAVTSKNNTKLQQLLANDWLELQTNLSK